MSVDAELRGHFFSAMSKTEAEARTARQLADIVMAPVQDVGTVLEELAQTPGVRLVLAVDQPPRYYRDSGAELP